MADISAFPLSSTRSAASGLNPSGTLGRFELRRQLSQGAQFTDWLAFDPRMQREVILKVLRAGGNEPAIRQWLQEALSLGRVKHPSIVPVLEADMHAQHAFLVSEYVEGETLAQLLARKGALVASEAVALMLDLLDALAVAHGEGVMHGGLTPWQILVDMSGRARIMNFGTGALERSGSAATQPSPALDLLACALVFAEMLLGQPLLEVTAANRSGSGRG